MCETRGAAGYGQLVVEVRDQPVGAVVRGARLARHQVVLIVQHGHIVLGLRERVGSLQRQSFGHLFAQGGLHALVPGCAGELAGQQRGLRLAEHRNALRRVGRRVGHDAVRRYPVITAVHRLRGARQQRLVQAAREQQMVAMRAHITHIQRKVARQADLGGEIPLLEPRDLVHRTGDAVGELRGGCTRHVAERGGGKRRG